MCVCRFLGSVVCVLILGERGVCFGLGKRCVCSCVEVCMCVVLGRRGVCVFFLEEGGV